MKMIPWETLKPILIGAAALIVAVLLIFAVYVGFQALTALGINPVTVTTLPLLAIGGVIVLIMVLTIVSLIFSVVGLTDSSKAMGLPEGSIRAVIALSLIVLFAILAVFLYQGVSTTPLNVVENLTEAERAQFLKDHASAQELQAVVAKDKDGQPMKKDDQFLYNVSYRSAKQPNTVADDFAKQLLVVLGTLMTAVTSFYLGAGTVTSAVAAAQAPEVEQSPKISGISPVTHSIASGAVIRLQVKGTNLKGMSQVRILRDGLHVDGTNVSSTATTVTCDIAVSTATTPPGGQPWEVEVMDGSSKSARLPKALTIDP